MNNDIKEQIYDNVKDQVWDQVFPNKMFIRVNTKLWFVVDKSLTLFVDNEIFNETPNVLRIIMKEQMNNDI